MTREIFRLVIHADGKDCAICGGKATVNGHCHKRKRHRGRLCHPWNAAIGLMKDNPRRLRHAADYLDAFEEQFDFEE